MKIYIPEDIAQAGKDYLLKRGYEIKPGSSLKEEIMAREVADCQGILVRTAPITEKIMKAGKELKVISKHGVGVDNIDMKAANQLGIQVTNGPMSNASSVAEHAVALMAAAARHIPEMDKNVRTGNWASRNQVKLTELEGKTLGLIGLGRIGKLTAQKAVVSFGMKIKAYDNQISQDLAPKYIEMENSLEKLFSSCHVISIHCPLTKETKGLVNSYYLSLMKPGSILVNCARGGIVDEKALYEALVSGQIGGAALDVLEQEPPKLDHPLLRLSNVIFSPHCAAHSKESFDRMAVHAAMGIDQALSQKEITWPVNIL